MDLITKVILQKSFTQKDIEEALLEICDRTHPNCDSDCPVYNEMTDEENDNLHKTGCPYHKSGQKMFKFIKDKYNK